MRPAGWAWGCSPCRWPLTTSARRTRLLAIEHLVAVGAISVSIAALVAAARVKPGPWTTTAASALAAVLVSDEIGWWIYLATSGSIRTDLVTAFPLQLCDAAIFVAALALIQRRPLLVEIAYFWGLAGTLQALITPDLPQHFPSFPYFQYYIAHGGVVAAALFLVVGLGCHPRSYAALRVTLITIAYAIAVGAIDAVTGANYLYLRGKPPGGSLLDFLGPWPCYIGWAAVVGLILLLVLQAPFRFIRPRPERVARHQA